MQAIVPWSYEGGIARLTCNGVSLNAKGEWLLPYWRELGGPTVCEQEPSLHGTAGVLITADQVNHPSHLPLCLAQFRLSVGCASSAAPASVIFVLHLSTDLPHLPAPMRARRECFNCPTTAILLTWTLAT